MNDKKDKVTLPSFDDLDFKPHASHPSGIQARLKIGHKDRFEISVVAMNGDSSAIGSLGGLYGNALVDTYEVAMFHYDKMLPLAKYDDVLGWQTPDQITKLMHQAILNDFAWVTLLYEIKNEYQESLNH
jgi:hypothetical protein